MDLIRSTLPLGIVIAKHRQMSRYGTVSYICRKVGGHGTSAASGAAASAAIESNMAEVRGRWMCAPLCASGFVIVCFFPAKFFYVYRSSKKSYGHSYAA